VAVPLSYITIIASPDKQTNEAASKSKGTAQFVDALYPNVAGEVEWTDWQHVASTDSIHKSL
jgi:hypothetical protein